MGARPRLTAGAAVISSRRHPLVGRIRRVAAGRDPETILLDGPHLVRATLDAGWPLEVAAVTTAARPRSAELADLLARLAAQNVPVVPVTPDVLDALSPVRSPTGIIALGRRHEIHALDAVATDRRALVLVVCDLQDPGNLGAIVRTADACGASGVVCAGACADPFGWKALRGAMGSTFRLPVLRVADAAGTLRTLQQLQVHVIAAVGRGGVAPDDVDWTGPVAIVLGNEGQGLPPEVAGMAETRVSIPMRAGVDSLNVAVAAGILLYAVARRRRAAGSGTPDDANAL